MTIGDRLKTLRQQMNMTAKNLADVLDIPVRTLGGYERNENPPNEKFLIRLLEKLNVNINWLLVGSGNMFNSDSDDLVSAIEKKYNISYNDACIILELIKNQSAREFILRFSEAKKGDIKAIDILIQNLTGIKVVFS